MSYSSVHFFEMISAATPLTTTDDAASDGAANGGELHRA